MRTFPVLLCSLALACVARGDEKSLLLSLVDTRRQHWHMPARATATSMRLRLWTAGRRHGTCRTRASASASRYGWWTSPAKRPRDNDRQGRKIILRRLPLVTLLLKPLLLLHLLRFTITTFPRSLALLDVISQDR